MAPLVSQIDSTKLRHDVQNEMTLICVTFGKDLFNIVLFFSFAFYYWFYFGMLEASALYRLQ